MPTIKIYSEATINETEAKQSFFNRSGKSFFRTVLCIFFSNRNYRIERRISKIRRASASSKQWSAMNDQEHVSHIYKMMAEEKAILRMLRLMD
jgi:hypothetical protein